MRNMLLVLVGTALGASALAAEIVYDSASGVADLTAAAAWTGGVVPGADDVVVFDGATPATLSLGAATAWAGIVRTNTLNALTLQAPVGGTLALGAEGLHVTAENTDFNRLNFDVDVALAADQTWTWEKNKSPCLKRALKGTGRLTLDLIPDEWGTRQGNIVIEGTLTAAVTATDGVCIFVLGNGVLETAPTLVRNAELVLIPGKTAGTFAFADLIPARTFANAGYLHFGDVDGDRAYTAFTNTITLADGDRITGPGTDTSDRQEGHLRVQDARVVSDGADVAGVWFDIRSGSWTQRAGDTALAYGAIVGRGRSADYGLAEQRLALEGGTFRARRLTVGLGNGDGNPAEVRVAGGTYAGTLPDEPSQWWATGLALASRTATGEKKWKDGKMVAFSDSEFAAGRLEMTEGTVKTPAVVFGNDNNVWSMMDFRSGARVGVSGGRLEVGGGGFRTASAWWDDRSMDRSWYDVVLSGGTLAFYRPGTVSPADMRLSDRAGGATVEVPAGVAAISGSLYGAGGLRKTGAGTLVLCGANDYTGRTDVVEGRLAVGDRFETAVWTGDACGGVEDGAPVAAWPLAAALDVGSAWTFAHATSTSIPNTEGTTPPTLARGAVNGHDALAFSGETMSFLTGNAAQPISGRSSFTVALVFQTEKGFAGSASEEIATATQIFGTSMDQSWTEGRLYGLALDEQGRVGCGMFGGRWQEGAVQKTMESENLWSTNRVNDGRPHVVVWKWAWNGSHVLRVDDAVFRLASPSNGVKQTAQTRILLGVGERQSAPVRRFRGLLADLRMLAGVASDARCTQLARELGVRYGVEAFAGTRLWNDVAEPARAEVPAATASWTADALGLPAGAAVDAWAEDARKGSGNGTPWTFTRALADVILVNQTATYPGTTESPVVAVDARTGRSFVSFNGRNACLALTGSSPTPVGGADGMTVSMVVRFTGRGQGGGSFSPANTAPFFGSAFGMDWQNGKENWQLTLSGASRLGFAHRWGEAGPETVRSRQRFLDDGEAHVVVARLPKKGTAETLALFVDGYKETSSFRASNTVHNTRILLGGSEYSGARYAPVDVAEIRLWKDAVLDDDQVRTLSADLAGRYGLDLAGATRGGAAAGQQRSREVFVHAGASFGGTGTHGNLLCPGQTLWGDGTADGLLTLAPGAVLKATATNTFACTGGLALMDRAVLAADFTSGAAVQPVAVTGDLVLEGGVTVRLAAPERMRPAGTLLTWTGACRLRGTESFTVEGDAASAVRVRLDTERKRLALVPIGGSVLLVR